MALNKKVNCLFRRNSDTMIREIKENDFQAIADIYNYYILNDICTFEVYSYYIIQYTNHSSIVFIEL